jgi:tetratricopeptide (TPR) repeat protein
VLDAQAWKKLAAVAEVTPLQSGYANLLRVRAEQALPGRAAPVADAGAIAALRCYIAKPVLDQIDAGQSDWLAEFRRVTTVFVRVRAIDYAQPAALADLHAATQAVQGAVGRYEGTFHRVIFDDKGTNMLCVWGIPGRAHEDDPARALSAAMAIQTAVREPGHHCGIGVTSGRVMCGLSGGGCRYEYTVAGDAVNLAARLMVAAGDATLCDTATRDAARGRFEFEALAPIQVKGRDDPLPVWHPRAIAASADKAGAAPTESRFLGRRAELAQLNACLDTLAHGAGAVMTIEGEPGVGKSQLVAEFQRAAAERGIGFLLGHADAIEHSTTYFAWREILRQMLAAAGARSAEEQRLHLETTCAAAPELRAWLPLVNDVLPAGFRETAAIRQMSEQARAETTRELLLQIFHHTFGGRPFVIVLEDAHWMDSMSWNLLARLRQREASLLLVLVTRSGHEPDDREGRELLARAAPRIALTTFSRADTEALVGARLGVANLPSELVTLIYGRTDGHPLFSEELAYSLRDSGYVTVRDGQCLLNGGAGIDARNLPATVEGIIASRVDRLSAVEQLTLKVASVLGHGFAARALRDVHPLQPGDVDIARQLDAFVALDLVHAQAAVSGTDYQFKHIITQEVTYGLLAFSQRRQLHRAAAGWYEGAHAADLSIAYPLLAHHWTRAGDSPKAFHFLHRAGEQAFKRYANREAAEFLEEARTLRFAPEQAPARTQSASCERLLGFSRLWLGHLDRGSAHIQNSLATLGHPIPHSRAALVTGIAGQFALSVRNHFLGRRFIRHDARQALVAGDIAESLIRLAHIFYFMSDTLRLVYVSLRCLNFAERAELSREVALIYAAMVSGAAAMPVHGLARRYGELALRAARAVDDPAITSQVHLFVSLYDAGIGDWQNGMARVTHAERLSRTVGDIRRTEDCKVVAGFLHLFRGEFVDACRCYEAAAMSGRDRGDKQTNGWGLLGVARVQLAQGRTQDALDTLRQAAPLTVDRLSGIELHGQTAIAQLRLGEFAESLRAARSGLGLLLEARPLSYATLTGTAAVAETLLALWQHARRGTAVDRADTLEREARRALGALRQFAWIFPIGRPRWRLQQGNFQLAAGKLPRALALWQKSADTASALQMPYDEALAALAIARHAGGALGTVAHARAAALFETLRVPEPAPVLP